MNWFVIHQEWKKLNMREVTREPFLTRSGRVPSETLSVFTHPYGRSGDDALPRGVDALRIGDGTLRGAVEQAHRARNGRQTVPEEANTDEVATLADMGMPDALDRFNRRIGGRDLYPAEQKVACRAS